jgi:hypothetical protein
MIPTIYGDIDEKHLVRKDHKEDDPLKTVHSREYYLGDKMVHRSAHITLKQPLGIEGILGATR